MTVYSKIIKYEPRDPKNPERDIDAYLKNNPGIDYDLLQNTPAIKIAVVKFMCSSKGTIKRTDKDIDKLVLGAGLKVIKELETHSKDPSKKANQLIRIQDDKGKDIERA